MTTLDRSRQENSHRWPQFLPDGQRFVFVARSGYPDKSAAFVGFLDGRAPVRLFETSGKVRYAGTGHILSVLGDALTARSLDETTLRLGEPTPVADGVAADIGMRARYSVSNAGQLVYQTLREPRFHLRWYDRTGHSLETLGTPDAIANVRISPDGRRVAFDRIDNPKGGRSVWVEDIATSGRSRVTFGEADEWLPIWSRDGTRVLFASYRNGPLDLFARPLDGSTPAEAVLESDVQKDTSDWSSDGRTLLVSDSTAENQGDVAAYSVGSGDRVPIATTAAVELNGRFSRDDRWVAYTSNESGRSEVYVQPFPPTGTKWQVTSEGGLEPKWSADGRELYYFEPGRGVMSLPVDTAPVFTRRPVLLVPVQRPALGAGSTIFDVMPDGRRFLIREPADPPASAPMYVVLNFAALLPKAAKP